MTHLPMFDGCKCTVRPCTETACRYHLLSDSPNEHGSRRETAAQRGCRQAFRSELGVTDTCALDVAEAGPQGQYTVAAMLGVTHQAIDLIEQKALRKLANMPPSRRRELFEAWGMRP